MPARPSAPGTLTPNTIASSTPALRGAHARDFPRRDVLALPAKRVADAVDEIIEALGVAAHQVAGAHPGVAGREHVAQDLLFRLLRFAVALETLRGFAADAPDRLAGLAVLTTNAKAVGAARRRLASASNRTSATVSRAAR